MDPDMLPMAMFGDYFDHRLVHALVSRWLFFKFVILTGITNSHIASYVAILADIYIYMCIYIYIYIYWPMADICRPTCRRKVCLTLTSIASHALQSSS